MCRIPLGNARPFVVGAFALEALDECYAYCVVTNPACQSPNIRRVQPTADSADVVHRWQSFLGSLCVV